MKEEKAMTATPVQPIVSPFYDRDGITIYNADCRQVLPLLGKFDLLLTDPPYGLNEKWGTNTGWSSPNINGHGRLWHGTPEWDRLVPEQGLIDVVVGMASKAIVWGGNYFAMGPARGMLSWDKVQEHSGSDFELAWTNVDTPAKVFRMSRADANINRRVSRKVHPTEKPIGLINWCFGFVPDAKTVLDPFMGSGTTLVAAKQLGLRAVGIEINREYCEAAVQRLRQGVLGFDSEG